ncbi:hypothetical protein GCM10009840_23850 [Pseudolysinimonas kribbensis]|uniref:Protein kinase domain-containing protein n=1 Tax=Pseudolysinimonas kribbensis TaxID=433641 RepID=A0ABQ6KBK6_9MICO|nr:hypothetical protein [Pseudolysinimonas kribbensis]GMA96860.1 hypothetical protein GCM10025881_36840 [Pseudolysinimonas kribbensis]
MDDGQEIGGYRVLRRLAVGARSTVLLAYDGEGADGVVLKVTPADDPAALREAAALDRGMGDHVVALLDACADDDRLALVLPRLPGPDLARLLADRTELEGGEAVTILAPLGATVGRLHARGVAHGALDAGSVLFDVDGAPVLIGFGAASAFDADLPEVGLEGIAGVASDRTGLRALAATVLGRVGGDRRAAARRLLARLASTPDAALTGVLASELFDVAAALPVRFADPSPPLGGSGGRLVPVSAPVAPDDGAPRPGWTGRVEALLDRSPAAEVKAAALRRWSGLPAARRKLLLATGVGALALIVAVVAIPSGPAPGAAAGAVAPSGSPTRSHPGRASASPRPAASDDPVRGDDPVAAATALLRGRERCRRELSVLCLDDVDQDGSSAALTDRDAIRAAQDGGELATDPLPASAEAAARLTERLGGSALVGLGGGASILLVDGADGWRIRDILPAPAVTPAVPQTPTPPPGG